MALEVIRSIRAMQKIADNLRMSGKHIGVVPTMGYLHDGHASLIHAATTVSDAVIVTLFVNPMQFAANEDLSRYPRDFEKDCRIAEDAGAHFLFAPSVEEMYPKGFATTISIDGITQKFEGVYRPTHFDGVATVVAKLFTATKPHIAVFGQKDYQQTLVIKRLVADLNLDIEIYIQPTIREPEGLAMSSRNVYLSSEQYNQALVISKAITLAMNSVQSGNRNREELNSILRISLLTLENIEIHYAAAANAETLEEPYMFSENDSIVFLVAVKIGSTRLIDNAVWNPN
ncbi:MAG: pantoate--beta-alanine ligase [Ignavibacteriae bacterium]|nr:pantoate--beta-alanine ligase [Ignavibacteriota bacterium]